MTITDLPLFHRAITTDSSEQVDAVLRALGRDWLTAAALGRLTGFSDRTLRSIANESDGAIISGQRGYKSTRYATIDEINHASNWLVSQAKKMERRAIAIQRRRHGN
jgi:hypothetical protein